jgi:short-subunit dehydrogenase
VLGPIDIWVNNAMVSVFSPVKEMTAEEFRRVTEVTYLGQVHGTLAALRRMLPRDRGVIIQVGSVLAYRGIPLQATYCGAKHAVQGFNESLRCELLHEQSNVRVTMVQLPALNTPQFDWVKTRLPNHPQPVPPIFQPEVAAAAIVWASEHDQREVVVGLPTLLAILGDKIAPGILDRYLARTGFAGQQTDVPVDPARPNNLRQPVDEEEDLAPTAISTRLPARGAGNGGSQRIGITFCWRPAVYLPPSEPDDQACG